MQQGESSCGIVNSAEVVRRWSALIAAPRTEKKQSSAPSAGSDWWRNRRKLRGKKRKLHQRRLESVEAEAPTVEEAEPPEPLPEGALLFQRRYEIVSFVSTHDGLNEYEAMETEPRKRCPVCQTLNTADSNYCEQCGHDLADADLETLKVRLLEAKSS